MFGCVAIGESAVCGVEVADGDIQAGLLSNRRKRQDCDRLWVLRRSELSPSAGFEMTIN
jgi:hypothetical protein